MTQDTRGSDLEILPILPLRNNVVFPASVVPVNVGRARSIRLIEDLLQQNRGVVGVVSQRDATVDDPDIEDLYDIGTVARMVKVVRLAPSNYSVVFHCLSRVHLASKVGFEPYLRAKVRRISEDLERNAELDAIGVRLRDNTRELVKIAPWLEKEMKGILDTVRETGALADLIASNLALEGVDVVDKQTVLHTVNVKERALRVLDLVNKHLDALRAKHEKEQELARVKEEISSMVVGEGKNQRELILRQQMKSIREELGETDDDSVDALRDRIRESMLPEEAMKIAKKQLSRLSGMQQQSAEYNVTRTYIEWLADLPWGKVTTDRLEPADVRRCLDEDHFGLEKVKKRIVEYIAVRKLRADKKGPILCFIGPPGVGKTSLGQSIARSMGRRYHRIALGGVRDEAEIRGHRRTYVGALPGRIIQGMKKVGVKNPVFVLDEIDKLGVDMMGDPSSALLEVLDPAQNNTFQDHYIDTPFDLSQVTFLATANNADTIPAPLWDRLETIEVPGYTRAEKKSIARDFLAPKSLASHGLTSDRLTFEDSGFETIIESYTREAGVRGLDREIGSVCRHVAMRLAEGENVRLTCNSEFAQIVLGPPRYTPELAERSSAPGVATGLAWTPSGGDILFIEASQMPGHGEIVITGNLKVVMKESAVAAMSFVRSHATQLGLDPEFLKTIDLHLHVPKGGTPKDGPSAGVTMYSAVASLLLSCSVRKDVAMTGEISLRGAVLPVGGIKEKLLAAHRAGIKEVLLPSRNEKDLEDVPKDVLENMRVHLIKRVDEVLPIVLEAPPPPAV
ncbi:MAG: endopeptidase La [Polyangiaceae bacterium]|nr:endopeptidase La [Polyangiaceae bacterium]